MLLPPQRRKCHVRGQDQTRPAHLYNLPTFPLVHRDDRQRSGQMIIQEAEPVEPLRSCACLVCMRVRESVCEDRGGFLPVLVTFERKKRSAEGRTGKGELQLLHIREKASDDPSSVGFAASFYAAASLASLTSKKDSAQL